MLGLRNRLSGSHQAETDGRGAVVSVAPRTRPGGGHTLAIQHNSIRHHLHFAKKKKKKIVKQFNEMSETVHEMEADVPAHHGTAAPGHFDSRLSMLEHSPSLFGKERQRPRTLTVWDSHSLCNNNHRLVFDSKMTINDSRHSRVCGEDSKEIRATHQTLSTLVCQKEKGLSIKTNNACFHTESRCCEREGFE